MRRLNTSVREKVNVKTILVPIDFACKEHAKRKKEGRWCKKRKANGMAAADC